MIIVYWIVDTHTVNALPDPVLPFAIFIIVLAVAFGFKLAIVTATLCMILVTYYLFEPRHRFNIVDYELMAMALLGVVASLYVGTRLRTRYQRMAGEKDELALSVIARDQFASVAAHELKTPLTTIKLYAEMIARKYEKNKQETSTKEAAETIDNEVNKLLIMINLLLDFAKLQRGKLAITPDYFDLTQLSATIIKIMQAHYPSHTFKNATKLKRTVVYADKVAIDRVITNLLSNAAKYSHERRTITLKVSKDGNNYVIAVRDQGVGIPKSQLPHLFEPFYQANDKQQGLGLGLYISHEIVQLHKGKIWAESVVGKGSTFYIAIHAADRDTLRDSQN